MAAKQKSVATHDGVTEKRIEYVQKYVSTLNTVRSEAERKLHDEHQHLSNVEDHIRRLQEKMRTLQNAAVELEGLEREHYDDRTQAEREVKRLNQLIDESRELIESLQEVASKAPTSYAVVPYEGPNGTHRRPIYIECVKDGVILQPESVHLSSDDLRPPYGAGNPLASVLRTAATTLSTCIRMRDKAANRNPIHCCWFALKDSSRSIAHVRRSRPATSISVSNWLKTTGS